MAQVKQPQQDGGFYGPEQPGRFHIIMGTFSKIMLFIFLAFFIFGSIVRPRAFNFSVNEAKLTEFNYTTTNSTLHYNLVLNVTAHNPNKIISIEYFQVEGTAFYEGTMFGTTYVIKRCFLQHPRSTDRMSGVISGQQVMMLDHDHVSGFQQDKRSGVFHIHVKLYFTIRYTIVVFFGEFVGEFNEAWAQCELKVPLSSNGTTMAEFEPTKCEMVNFCPNFYTLG